MNFNAQLLTVVLRQIYYIFSLDTCSHETPCNEWDAKVRWGCFKVVQRYICSKGTELYVVIFRCILVGACWKLKFFINSFIVRPIINS